MLLPLIKANAAKKQFKLYTPFVFKSRFIDLEFKKCVNYSDSRVDHSPLISNQVNYRSLVRAWYLVLALRMVKAPLVTGKMPIFLYRRTKLFTKHQDLYAVSLGKLFYETLVEHNTIFYCLTVSTLLVDRLYLILCLYSLKSKNRDKITVIKECSAIPNTRNDLIRFILRQKWKFKVTEFTP